MPGMGRTVSTCRATGRRGLFVALVAAAGGAAGGEPGDFSASIQPLFARRCLACHGPETRQAGLRLDEPAGATGVIEGGGRAIVPGDPDASSILARITSPDPDIRMPPEGPPLDSAEVDAIRRWIAAGAEWEDHWAFRPLERPAVPLVDGIVNPVDAFIRDGLAERRLPTPRTADRITPVSYTHLTLPTKA